MIIFFNTKISEHDEHFKNHDKNSIHNKIFEIQDLLNNAKVSKYTTHILKMNFKYIFKTSLIFFNKL